MKLSLALIVSVVLAGGFLTSCGGSHGSSPDDEPVGGMTLVERNYLKSKAEAGFSWKTRAEEIIRQSKASGNYFKNEFRIQRAYQKVDANLQVWANAVASDAKEGKAVAETKEYQVEIEDSLKELGEAAGVPGSRGWKRDLVVALIKVVFPVSAPVVDRVNLALNQAEAERLRVNFIRAHRLTPAAQLPPAKLKPAKPGVPA